MLRKIARPMLSSVFVIDGVDTLRHTADHVGETEYVLARLRKVVPSTYSSYIPSDPELVTRAVGAAKTGAGSMFGLGKAPRTSAAILAATTLPTMLGRDAFWEAKDKEEKSERRSGFLTNTALLGALFIAAQDTEGKPSLRWRAQKAGARTNKKIQQALPTKSESQKYADQLSDRANEFSGKATDWFGETSDKVQSYIDDNKDDWQNAGKGLLATAKSYVDEAKDYIDDNKDDWQDAGKGLFDSARSSSQDWLAAAESNAKTARKSAVKKASKAQDRADKAFADLDTKSGKRSLKKASKNADKLQTRADKALAKAIKKVGDAVNS